MLVFVQIQTTHATLFVDARCVIGANVSLNPPKIESQPTHLGGRKTKPSL